MALVGTLLFLVLSAIAALHVWWGLGGLWPANNERNLVALVVGKTGMKRMPSSPQCFLAAGAIFATGLLALLAARVIGGSLSGYVQIVSALIGSGIFLGRGFAGFLPAWRAQYSQLPFATFDQRYYSPFCLIVGVGFVGLLLRGLSLI